MTRRNKLPPQNPPQKGIKGRHLEDILATYTIVWSKFHHTVYEIALPTILQLCRAQECFSRLFDVPTQLEECCSKIQRFEYLLSIL